jgi:DNA-binding Lrp family transcriptional regulator
VSKGAIVVKDVELKLLSELMKNSRRSDRELAKIIGVSQPTVSRTIRRLEKEGYIKEYTFIPDFAKLGFEILAITFLGYETVSAEDLQKATKIASDMLQRTYMECICIETGNGFGYEAAVVSFHKSYSEYGGFMNRIRQAAHERYPFMDTSKYQSFLISLKSESRFRPLTLSTLANHILTLKEKKA